MKKIGLLFPHQLYKESPLIAVCDTLYLIEDELYFKQYKFHKQKLVLHRASMKYYANYLTKKTQVVYIQAVDNISLSDLIGRFKNHEIHYYKTDDYLLERRIKRFTETHQIKCIEYENPNFLNTQEEVSQLLKSQKNYFMANFYASSRKRHQILVDHDNKPIGGKWSFDTENRKKVPKGTAIPTYTPPSANEWVKEAQEYVNQNFGENYGDAAPFFYPINHAEAEIHLQHFIQQRFADFGIYEDAIVKEEHWLWHSVLTPMLNIGLLCPKQIIDAALAAQKECTIPLNSLEGFIRQILGWREFIRGIYHLEGVKQRTTNHFGYSRKIPESFWTGKTGILPIDQTIQKLLKTGYSHHIERLMILGNFMLLCEFDPDEVHRWFMEMYVDAYDWVMVPNVYGMTQYADGGLMTTKPYCSGSNYILKMSDYTKGNWCEIWNALYWRFIYVNQDEFGKNRRMSMMVNLARKMEGPKMNEKLQMAEEFLESM